MWLRYPHSSLPSVTICTLYTVSYYQRGPMRATSSRVSGSHQPRIGHGSEQTSIRPPVAIICDLTERAQTRYCKRLTTASLVSTHKCRRALGQTRLNSFNHLISPIFLVGFLQGVETSRNHLICLGDRIGVARTP